MMMTVTRAKTIFRQAATLALLLTAAGCGGAPESPIAAPPQFYERSAINEALRWLPPPQRKPVVAVYNFTDQTGARKPSENFAQYTAAVSQGVSAILVKALQDAGQRQWFTVVERSGLDSLLKERQIIRSTREEYATSGGRQLSPLRPLLYAGVLIEGGVVAYDSNTVTGGLGARYLGVGIDTDYRQDMVTVELRALSVQTGEVLVAVTTTKTIYSIGLQGSIYKFVSLNDLLEAEGGFTYNEPPQMAVREAIELGVYGLIVEGSVQGLWDFADQARGDAIRNRYLSADLTYDEYGNVVQQSRIIMPDELEHVVADATMGSRIGAPESSKVISALTMDPANQGGESQLEQVTQPVSYANQPPARPASSYIAPQPVAEPVAEPARRAPSLPQFQNMQLTRQPQAETPPGQPQWDNADLDGYMGGADTRYRGQ